jgi:hypothetical protein
MVVLLKVHPPVLTIMDGVTIMSNFAACGSPSSCNVHIHSLRSIYYDSCMHASSCSAFLTGHNVTVRDGDKASCREEGQRVSVRSAFKEGENVLQ